MPAKYEPVTPEVVRWAIAESGYAPAQIADHLKTAPETVQAWCDGTERPTVGQLTKLSRRVRRPRELFYLPQPPREAGIPATLRTANGADKRELAPPELLAIRRARRIQRMVAFLRRDAPADVPRFKPADDVARAGDELRAWSGVSLATARSWKSDLEARRAWTIAIEDRGVLVTSYSLKKDGLRGFALPDPAAPLIAVNTAHNDGSRSFTMWHELAHLAVSRSATCLTATARRTEERWCDEVAAEVTLPRAELGRAPLEQASDDRLEFITAAARYFRVSMRAAAVALGRDDPNSDEDYELVSLRAPASDTDKPRGFGRNVRNRLDDRLREVGILAARSIIAGIESGEVSEHSARKILRLDGFEIAQLSEAIGG